MREVLAGLLTVIVAMPQVHVMMCLSGSSGCAASARQWGTGFIPQPPVSGLVHHDLCPRHVILLPPVSKHLCCLLQVQEEMLHTAYTDDVLCLPKCGVMIDHSERYIWRGPRVRMGACQDVPQAIMPHSTSGRADYFGSAVNRWVSLCIQLLRWRICADVLSKV